MPLKTVIPGGGVEDGGRVSNSGKAFQTRPVFTEVREKGEGREWTF